MINDDEGMNNALDYYREKDKYHYWGDWTDEDPYSAEEYDEANGVSEEEGWKDDYDDYDTYDDDYYDYEGGYDDYDYEEGDADEDWDY